MSSGGADWERIELLAEPTRRRAFEAVRDAGRGATRDDVAAALGISRRLAAFHLERLADAGLLRVDDVPAAGHGRGVGRPAKRYRAGEVELDLSVPPRRYDVAARLLATGVAGAGGDARRRAFAAAAEEGERTGQIHRVPPRARRGDRLAVVLAALTPLGYEPEVVGGTAVRLRNCPFHSVVDIAPELVCGMNQRLICGLLRGAGVEEQLDATLDGTPPDCCVTVRAN